MCEVVTDRDIRAALDDLPVGLADALSRISAKIIGSTAKARVARKVFQWIICACRPLSVDELKEAVAVDLEDTTFDTSKRPGTDNLIRSCQNLIRIDRTHNIVELIHHSVRQHLLGSSTILSGSPYVSLRSAETFVGNLCVTYMCLRDFETTIARYPRMSLHPDTLTSTFARDLPFGNMTARLQAHCSPVKQTFRQTACVDLNASRIVPQRDMVFLSSKFVFLEYVLTNFWAHTQFITPRSRFWPFFKSLILENNILDSSKPWKQDTFYDDEFTDMFRWACKTNHFGLLCILNDIGKLYMCVPRSIDKPDSTIFLQRPHSSMSIEDPWDTWCLGEWSDKDIHELSFSSRVNSDLTGLDVIESLVEWTEQYKAVILAIPLSRFVGINSSMSQWGQCTKNAIENATDNFRANPNGIDWESSLSTFYRLGKIPIDLMLHCFKGKLDSSRNKNVLEVMILMNDSFLYMLMKTLSPVARSQGITEETEKRIFETIR